MTPALRSWLYLLRVPLVLLGVFAFFSLYNRFILDQNLQNLRASFEVLDGAQDVGQAEAALLLVDKTLTAQMAQADVDLRAAVTLQYSREALSSAKSDRPVDDAQVLVGILQEVRTRSRSPLLMSVDDLVTSAAKKVREAALVPKQALARPLSPVIDVAQLEEAARLERQGKIPQALGLYRSLLEYYPGYNGRTTLKLRIGSLLQKSSEFPEAQEAYRQALAGARTSAEQALARQMLQDLTVAWERLETMLEREQQLSRMPMGTARQKAAFDLGSAWIQNSDFNRAAESFEESHRAAPEGELATAARFKQGWCLRAAGRIEEAFTRMAEVARTASNPDLQVAALLQIAEMYKASGNFNAAVETYERVMARQSNDAALTSIAYALAGCTYEFDLNEPGKARIFFREVAKKFPASPYSSVGRRLEKLRVQKGRAEAGATTAGPGVRPSTPVPVKATEPSNLFAVGSPLLNWLENFLPVFVSVFNDRLTKYMEAVGEKELTRRFSEAEFGELVLREVERRFPGQVTGIQTKIHPDGFTGSGDVHLVMLKFRVEAKIGIVVKDFKPNAILQNIRIGKIDLPSPLLKFLQERVNQAIDRKRYTLRVKEYKLNEGYALISVEVAE